MTTRAGRLPRALALALALAVLAGCGATRHVGGGLAVRRDSPNPETTRLTWLSAVGELAARWRGAVGVHGTLGLMTIEGAETTGAAVEVLTGPTAQLCRPGACIEARASVGGGISDYGYGPDSTVRRMLVGEALVGLRLRLRAEDDVGVRLLLGPRWKWIEDGDAGDPAHRTQGLTVAVTIERAWR